MPSFRFTNKTPTSVTIIVENVDPAYPYHWIYFRDNVPVEQWNGIYYVDHTEARYHTSSFQVRVTGLSPDSSYLVNVSYSHENKGDYAQLVGAKTLNTPAETDGGAQSSTYIYAFGKWRKATPYIYAFGEWRKAKPSVSLANNAK